MMNCIPLAIANFFIAEAIELKLEINHLKLQKLVYCAHGWSLSLYDKPLIATSVQAWKHGPVIPNLFHILKPFGMAAINELQSTSPIEEPPKIENKEVEILLIWVWKRYRHLDASQLSDLTHSPGTPWHNVIDQVGYPPPVNQVICNDLIKKEFNRIHRNMTTNV